MRSFRIIAAVAALATNLPIASAFSPLLPSSAFGRRATTALHLRMGSAEQGMTRRAALEGFGKLSILVAAAPLPVMAVKGDYAKIDMSGTASTSQSSLGPRDVPAAGKIDPYDNREEANAVYGLRMQDPAVIEENRAKAAAVKEEIFTVVSESLGKEDWRTAKLVMSRDLQPLRRSMNVVSTRGKRAVSAAQRGGDPEKALDKIELSEKKFLKEVNALAVICDGESPVNRKTPGGINYRKAGDALVKAEKAWAAWVDISAGV
ncbi:hypothetical protein T484DRAFT_3172864 [Baffinella frigidus]|nr:hypothetical protein T484DRAFT_3172864 [Cryptophyta sp. CCMP2293]